MARIRTIKPEFWTDPFMVDLEPFGRLMFLALLTCADDHGFIPDEPERIALEVMPKEDALEVDRWIQFFEAAGKLERYVGPGGENFLKVKNWERHQRVDRPSKSRVFREGSRKVAIPAAVRREVAQRYGCEPGHNKYVSCYYCGADGYIYWPTTTKGRPGFWVAFGGVEMDHLDPESSGGKTSFENIVLACRHCNRSKGTQHWIEFFSKQHGLSFTESAREGSRVLDAEQGSGNRDQGTGKTPLSKPNGSDESDEPPPDRFEEFWANYPRKEGKKKARTAWTHLSQTKREAAINDCATRYRDVDKAFIPLPTTYLHGERWNDDPIPPKPAGNDGLAPAVDNSGAADEAIRRFRARHGNAGL